MAEYMQRSKLKATEIQNKAAVGMQNIYRDRKDKIDKGIAIILRANTHTEKKGKKKKQPSKKVVVMSLICHTLFLITCGKKISEEFESIAEIFTM